MSDEWKTTIISDFLDNDIIPFWDGLKEKKFLLYKCSKCSAHYWPMTLCPKHDDLLFEDMDWAPTSGRGNIFSFTVVNRVTNPAWQSEVPYALILVELDEGPIFGSRLVGKAPSDLAIGQRVEVIFDVVPETGMTLPLFRRCQ